MTAFQKIVLIFLIAAASVVATFITPGMNEIKKLFLISSQSLSYVMGFYLTGYVIGQISFAFLSKLYGSTFSLRCGFVLSLIGFLLQYLSVSCLIYNIFLLGRFISALGLSAGLICGFAIIKDNIIPNEERSYLSIIAIAFTGSIYFSIFISGILTTNMGLVFVLKTQIFYALTLLMLTFFIPDTNSSPEKGVPVFRFRLVNFKLISYSLSLSMTTIIAYCYSFYAPIIMIGNFGLDAKSYGYYNLINMIALFLGSIIYGRINKIFREDTIIKFNLISMSFLGLISVIKTAVGILIFQEFIFLFFAMNIFAGMLYPAATFKSLECGICKISSSAVMNVIKIGMPNIALYCSLFVSSSNFLNLSFIVFFFSSIYLVSVIVSLKLDEPDFAE